MTNLVKRTLIVAMVTVGSIGAAAGSLAALGKVGKTSLLPQALQPVSTSLCGTCAQTTGTCTAAAQTNNSCSSGGKTGACQQAYTTTYNWFGVPSTSPAGCTCNTAISPK